MICPYCGKETLESSSTCNRCGRWLLDAGKLSLSETIPQIPASLPDASPEVQILKAEQAGTTIEGSPPQSSVVTDQPAGQPEIPSPGQIKPPKDPTKAGMDKWSLCFIGCVILLCLAFSCVVVIWLFFSFSNVLDFIKSPTAIPTPSPTPSVLYFDDFSNLNSGWPVSNDGDYINDYYQGGYRMVENITNTTSWVYPDMSTSMDMIVEVDATNNGGPDENNMGVICRFRSNDEFYYGLITSDGYYAIVKMALGEFSVIGGEYIEYSDLINQGATANHIQLDCIGDVLTLYVNGNLIDQQTDTDYASGQAGLIIGTYDTPGTDILFDNIYVYTP
jgi:hypothetical protein